jgi:hypothetical protein
MKRRRAPRCSAQFRLGFTKHSSKLLHSRSINVVGPFELRACIGAVGHVVDMMWNKKNVSNACRWALGAVYIRAVVATNIFCWYALEQEKLDSEWRPLSHFSCEGFTHQTYTYVCIHVYNMYLWNWVSEIWLQLIFASTMWAVSGRTEQLCADVQSSSVHSHLRNTSIRFRVFQWFPSSSWS